jgi:hypothetical protein
MKYIDSKSIGADITSGENLPSSTLGSPGTIRNDNVKNRHETKEKEQFCRIFWILKSISSA